MGFASRWNWTCLFSNAPHLHHRNWPASSSCSSTSFPFSWTVPENRYRIHHRLSSTLQTSAAASVSVLPPARSASCSNFLSSGWVSVPPSPSLLSPSAASVQLYHWSASLFRVLCLSGPLHSSNLAFLSRGRKKFLCTSSSRGILPRARTARSLNCRASSCSLWPNSQLQVLFAFNGLSGPQAITSTDAAALHSLLSFA